VSVNVSVKNTGKIDGEEVVQLYVSGNSNSAPIRSLKGFKRVFLKAGESKDVKFNLAPADISIVDDNGNAKQYTGKVTIAVGGAQPGDKVLAIKKSVQGVFQVK
jgi:beta-glucosidase